MSIAREGQTKITSDGGLLAYRELDDALDLTTTGASALAEGWRGTNIRHRLLGLLQPSPSEECPIELRGRPFLLSAITVQIKGERGILLGDDFSHLLQHLQQPVGVSWQAVKKSRPSAFKAIKAA